MNKGFRIAIGVCLAAAGAWAAAQSGTGTPQEFEGQTEPLRVVHILDEPRHRTVHKGDNFRLLDVQINPGDTTLPHTHDSPILYTFISNGQGPLNGRLSSVTSYVDEPLTHRVNNPGPGLFRIIALAGFGPAIPDMNADLPQGISQPAELENSWFRAWRLNLPAGSETGPIRHVNPAFAVQVSSGTLTLTREDGMSRELLAPGDWAAVTAAHSYRIVNTSDQAVSVVIKEARQPGAGN